MVKEVKRISAALSRQFQFAAGRFDYLLRFTERPEAREPCTPLAGSSGGIRPAERTTKDPVAGTLPRVFGDPSRLVKRTPTVTGERSIQYPHRPTSERPRVLRTVGNVENSTTMTDAIRLGSYGIDKKKI